MKTRIFYTLFFTLSVYASIVSAQQPTAAPKSITAGIVNSKAINLPKPEYPAAAQAVKASGAVNVQVTIDEQGSVISATAVSGHPLLRAASEKAALAAKFSPTLLSGKAVKVTGVIVYNFVAEAKPNYEEKLRTIALGAALFSNREMDSPGEDFESILYEIPDYYPQVKSLAAVKGASKQKRVELIDEAIFTLKGSFNGSEAWQFELGEQMGGIFVEAKKYEDSNFTYKVNTEALKSNLRKIRELGDSAPADFPAEVLEKIKDIGLLSERDDVAGDELLAMTIIRLMKLVNTVSPE